MPNPSDPNILGPTVGIDAGSAAERVAELLAQRVENIDQSTTPLGQPASGAESITSSAANLPSEDALDLTLAGNHQAQIALPQAALPEIIAPQIAVPQVASPQVAAPQVQVTAPPVALQQVTAAAPSEIASPEIASPVASPEIITSPVALPRVAPQVALSEVAAPQVISPQIVAPSVASPPVASASGLATGENVPTSGANLPSEDALDLALDESQSAGFTSAEHYLAARKISREATQQAKEEYTGLGLHDLTENNSPIFKDYARRVRQESLHQAGYVDTPDIRDIPVSGGPTLFESARHLDRVTTSELDEEWTGSGRYNEIGRSKGYKKELEERQKQARYEAGFTNDPNAPIEHKESLKDILGGMDMAYAVGYGGMQTIGNEQKAFAPMLSGEAYLSDQVAEQATTGALPLIGAIGGTLLGLKGGPAAGLAGQYIGQSIGVSAEDSIDTYLGGHTYAQERAGEAIGSGQGGADAVKELTTALQSALTPAAKELAETLTALSRNAPVGAAAPSEFGQFQFGMGTAFAANAQGEEQFLSSNPFLAPIRNAFNSHPFTSLTPDDYLGNAAAAAMSGDYGGMKASFAFAETETDRNTANPTYQRDGDFIKRREGESVFQKGLEDVFEPTRVRAYNFARQRFTTEDPDGPGAAHARQSLAQQEDQIRQEQLTHTLDTANVGYAGSLLGGDSATLSGVMSRGGGAAAIRAAMPGMAQDAGLAESALQKDIADNNSEAQKHPLIRAVFMANSATDREQLSKIRSSLDATGTEAFKMGLGEEQSRFGLFASRDSLRGDSAAALEGGYDRQAEFLRGEATNPRNPLTPTERAGILQSADQMRYTAGRNVFAEAQGRQGVREVQGQGQIGIAETYGSPLDVYQASLAQIGNEQGQVSLIDGRLKQHILMPERIGLENQRQSIENEIAIQPERARVDAYNAEGSILGNEQAAGRSQLDRSQQVFGRAAFTPDIFKADQENVSLYTGAEDSSPQGSQQRAQFGRQRADAVAQMQQDRDSSYRFGDQATRVRDVQAEGKFSRDMKNPYQDGDPNNNPMTAGRDLEGVYKRDLTGAEAALRSTPKDSPAYEQNAEAVEGYKDKLTDIEQERRTGFLKFLPELIGGSPGQGNLSGVLPTPGQSAFYNGNPFISGTFGQPNRQAIHDGEGHVAQVGGAVGAFLAGTGVANGVAGASSGIVSLTAAINGLRQDIQRGGQIGGRSPAIAGSPLGFNQATNLAIPGSGYRAAGQ